MEMIQSTVPSPPATMIFMRSGPKVSTNQRSKSIGSYRAVVSFKSTTCTGCNKVRSLFRISTPSCPPDLGFTKHRIGVRPPELPRPWWVLLCCVVVLLVVLVL